MVEIYATYTKVLSLLYYTGITGTQNVRVRVGKPLLML